MKKILEIEKLLAKDLYTKNDDYAPEENDLDRQVSMAMVDSSKDYRKTYQQCLAKTRSKEAARLDQIRKIVEEKETTLFIPERDQTWKKRIMALLFGVVSKEDPVLNNFKVRYIQEETSDFKYARPVDSHNTLLIRHDESKNKVAVQYYQTFQSHEKQVIFDSQDFSKPKDKDHEKTLKCAALSALGGHLCGSHFMYQAAENHNPEVFRYFISLAQDNKVDITNLLQGALRIAVKHRRTANVAAILEYKEKISLIEPEGWWDLKGYLGEEDTVDGEYLHIERPIIDITILLQQHGIRFPDNQSDYLNLSSKINSTLMRQTIALSLYTFKLNKDYTKASEGKYINVISLANQLFINHPKLALAFYQNNSELFRNANFEDIISISNLKNIISQPQSIDILKNLLLNATSDWLGDSLNSQPSKNSKIGLLLKNFCREDMRNISASLKCTSLEKEILTAPLSYIEKHWDELTLCTASSSSSSSSSSSFSFFSGSSSPTLEEKKHEISFEELMTNRQSKTKFFKDEMSILRFLQNLAQTVLNLNKQGITISGGKLDPNNILINEKNRQIKFANLKDKTSIPEQDKPDYLKNDCLLIVQQIIKNCLLQDPYIKKTLGEKTRRSLFEIDSVVAYDKAGGLVGGIDSILKFLKDDQEKEMQELIKSSFLATAGTTSKCVGHSSFSVQPG